MTYEELEKLKKDHDYCIIPIKNIIGIDEDMPIQNYGIMTVKIKPDVDTGNFMQFVNSAYFGTKGWYKNIDTYEPTDKKKLYKALEKQIKDEYSLDKIISSLLGEVREVEDD